ncbi:MAG: SDR family oxidoreductase [Firmicutes bacterium]|nr:SDR family oxidoreductase [Bacillota bacterium]
MNTFPRQRQRVHPGKESAMHPQPQYDNPDYKASGKLLGKVALISGGDSGIGRAVALAYAKEGASVAILYLNENSDAEVTKEAITAIGANCLTLATDIRSESRVKSAVAKVLKEFGRIDILVNNSAVQFPQSGIENISRDQLKNTFETNIFGMFYLTKEVLPHLKSGSAIINTASVAGFKGNENLIDYSATKGAINAFTYSLATSLMGQNIRVNAVAPGPVWTPLIVSSFNENHISQFGQNTPMKRVAQPYEMAPAYVYLASEDSSNMSGQIMHLNSGEIV